jgi:hypothetical protein
MNTLFLVAMIFEALFGIGFLLVPAAMMDPLGVAVDDVASTFARVFGSTLISFAVMLWFARKSDRLEHKRGVACGLFVYYLISAMLFVLTQTSGLMNSKGWGLVVLHAVFAALFGYFIVKKPAGA